MTPHPRANGFDRRAFVGRSALGLAALSGLSGVLAGCGGGSSGGGGGKLQLARADNPVTWPIFDDNPRLAPGLEPEAGPLRIYNWIDYLNKDTLKKFGKEYGVKVELTTYSTGTEAFAKIASGKTDFDVTFPTLDGIGRLVLGKHLMPLEPSYVPNLQISVWPALRSPFYDVGAQYTVPYTVYTAGLGYRADKVKQPPDAYDNPWDILFETAHKGKTWLLDDSRDATGALLLRNGITDMNTENPADLEVAKRDLLALIDAVNVKASIEDYSRLPEGSAWVHQAWSGSMIAAPYYLPKGVPSDVLGYWYPPDGVGQIGNDTMAVLRTAKNPVLAHHFLNYLLDETHGYENFSWVGYQPPFLSLGADRLITDEMVPAHLATAVVRESDFARGSQPLELSPEGKKLWEDTWAEFKAGV